MCDSSIKIERIASYIAELIARQTSRMSARYSSEIEELRRACERARGQYLAAQYLILCALYSTRSGRCGEPTAAQYDNAAALGRAASDALHAYLDRLNVPRRATRSAIERKLLIHSLSANERLWQPSPEDWLKEHGFKYGWAGVEKDQVPGLPSAPDPPKTSPT